MTEARNNTGPRFGSPDALVGYQFAGSAATFYGTMVWSIFNAMLVANSIVIAGVALILAKDPPPAILKELLPTAGLLLCATWFLVAKRAHEYTAYYVNSARELEECELSPVIKIVSRGATFAKGLPISLIIGGSPSTQQLSSVARLVRGEWTSYSVIAVFVVIYVGILLQFQRA